MRMDVSTINKVLGQRAGVLELVLGLLLPRDMKDVVLVCRLSREVGEAPGFWSWVVLRVTRENMLAILERMKNRRFKAVKELRVSKGVVSEELLEAVVRLEGLRVVDMAFVNLSTLGMNSR